MVWFIVCFGVVIAAFAMWDNIHDELPDQLRLPRSTETILQGAPASSPSATAVDANHWAVSADATNLRASREFLDGIVAGDTRYYPPILHVSCYNGSLFAWMATGLQSQAAPDKPGYTAVRLNGGPIEYWQKADGALLISPAPAKLIEALHRRAELTAEVAFEEAPTQNLRIGTEGIAALMPRLSHCAAPAAQ